MEIEPEDAAQPASIVWGVASRALAGEAVSGDRALVQPYTQGVLVAVVDGLGHGKEAAYAADCAIATLQEYAHELIHSLLPRAHAALRGTRGAVLSLASFCTVESTMTWAGIGDVEGVLIRGRREHRAREYVQHSGGIVGYQLPPLRAAVVPVVPGDTLIFATDGVAPVFMEEPVGNEEPSLTASRLLSRYAKATDDALVLVARYVGAQA